MDVPSFPERPPELFQFHLKHLLAFMLASCFVAFGVRLAIGYLGQLPPGYLPHWLNVSLAAMVLGALAYFFLRLPFVAVGVTRFRSRWRAVRRHRSELAEWAKARQGDSKRIMDENSGEPTGERGASAP